MTLISNISVFQGVYPVQLNTPTSQQFVFTLPHIMAPKFSNHLPNGNVGRTCSGSGNVWNWESRSRCMGTLENTEPHKIRCDIFFFKFCSVEMLSVQFAPKPPRETLMSCENQRIKAFGLLTWESRFQFQKLLCKLSWSRDKTWPQKSNQNSSGDYEVTFARNSLYMLECRHLWIFPNTAIFTWITNFFIGYEDIYCQCMIFHYRATIWSISLLAVHPLISSTVRSDHRCARQKR